MTEYPILDESESRGSKVDDQNETNETLRIEMRKQINFKGVKDQLPTEDEYILFALIEQIFS